jgi:enoyl-CoA hydratase/carnithine racemase
MDKSSDALDAATYFAALHKRINGGRMPNSLVGSLLGQNITASQANQLGLANGAAQQSLLNNGAQQAQWNASANIVKGTIKPMYPDVRNDRLELFFKVTQVENI